MHEAGDEEVMSDKFYSMISKQINNTKLMVRVAVIIFTFHFSLFTSLAQSLYEQNIRLGELFQRSGCMTQAEHFFQTAFDNVDKNDRQQWLSAQLHMVDLMKFWRPIDAQRLSDEIIDACKDDPILYQKALALNASISFWVDNKRAFSEANEAYLKLCRQYDNLPDTYDKPLQAMNEALSGYYDEAMHTIDQFVPKSIFRHELRLHIFQMKGDKDAIIEELKQRTNTIDSLSAASYYATNNEVAVTKNMTLAQQKAEQRSSFMVILTLSMAAVVILMFMIWIILHRRNQKKLEKKNEQLSTALKMANETEQMKSEFVKRVSHEIRTPLNAITGFNEILNNPDIPLPQEERQNLLDRISENVKAITGIVDELLQVANTESMQDYACYDTMLCNQYLSQLIYNHRDDVNANVELRYTTTVMNRFSIQTNKEMMQKIIEHLLGNAIKFTQRGYIELNCAQTNDNVIISVTDTGCGIPPEKQDEVFEQFAKADIFRQGIGLGLTVSRKMAQKMGGDLKLDKTYTTGARFVLTLPVK